MSILAHTCISENSKNIFYKCFVQGMNETIIVSSLIQQQIPKT